MAISILSMSYWHTFIPYNAVGFTAEDQAVVHVITLIKTDTPEHFCPCPEFPVCMHDFIVDNLFFPFRVFLNKLRINMLGMILELGIKEKCPLYIEQGNRPS